VSEAAQKMLDGLKAKFQKMTPDERLLVLEMLAEERVFRLVAPQLGRPEERRFPAFDRLSDEDQSKVFEGLDDLYCTDCGEELPPPNSDYEHVCDEDEEEDDEDD
jgi:glycerol-3-phosphate dehydrogenase